MSGTRVITLACRTSDRLLDGCRGATTIAELLAEAVGTEPHTVGTSSDPRVAPWSTDLDGAREGLLGAARQLEEALTSDEEPVVLHGECSLALSTLPTVARMRPDARFLWLDAHGDYNTPDTTQSSYLGGMALSGACGEWDPDLQLGFADPGRVVLAGGREFDAAERKLIDASGMAVVEGREVLNGSLAAALGDDPVFVHLDLDILEKDELPVLFPSAGGLEIAELRQVLARVADGREIIGFEVTNFQAPIDEFERKLGATAVKRVVEPLLDALKEGAHVRN